MKILVTGANGYLGQGIVKQLLDLGHEVIATDLVTDKIDSRTTTIHGNLFEIENPYEYFNRPEVLLHLAWRDGFIHNSINHIIDIPCHHMFLKSMMESGIKRVSIMGSMHEIGFYEGSINENTPCNPLSFYGIAKDMLRKSSYLLAQSYGVVYQWMRGYYIVGNSSSGSSIFSKITAAEREGRKEFPFTTGQNQYDFLNYEDFCYQVAATVGQDKIDGIINICSGKPEKLCDRVERFIHDNNYNIKLKYGIYPDRKYDSLAVWGNNDKIQKILNNN